MHSTDPPFYYTLRLILYLILISCTAGCSPVSPLSTKTEKPSGRTEKQISKPAFTIFLIGDTGAVSAKPRSEILTVLEQQLHQYGPNSAVIFLGDNVYPNGLPPQGSPHRKQAERRLEVQLKTVKDYSGRIIFIPGNHDWHSSGHSGLEWIRRQERFIESYLERGNTFLPDSGYPGPVSISLGKAQSSSAPPMKYNIQLVLLDTQWWLHPYRKPFSPGIQEETDQQKQFLANLKNIFRTRQTDEILIAAHHPLFSYGRHGGHFPPRAHLLPPVFGSLYVAYRNIWGYQQDIANYRYFKSRLLEIMNGRKGVIYASGHEHSLQFIPRQIKNGRQYFIVSGAGSKSSYVKHPVAGAYTYEGLGFAAIHFYADRKKKIEFWNARGQQIYSKTLPSTVSETHSTIPSNK